MPSPPRPARSPLSRIRILLVSPKSPGNVGAAARAVKNTGLGRLDIVEPVAFRDPDYFPTESAKLATGALDVLRRVRAYPTLDQAVRPSTYLVATSARDGRSLAATTPREAAPRLLALARDRDVAILFGAESRGLPNRLLSRASELVRIPADPRHAVLNLAQAVLLIGYELYVSASAERAAAAAPVESAPRAAASAETLDGLQREALEAMRLLDFLKPHSADRIAAELAALVARARPTAREASLLRGLARQVRWLARQAAQAPDRRRSD